jgi:type VI secretion system secreted protein VgrG
VNATPFDLDELQHYDHDQGSPDDRQFLLMSVESEGHNNYLSGHQASYYNTFSCVRKKIVFRPQLTTPRPTISGPKQPLSSAHRVKKSSPMNSVA